MRLAVCVGGGVVTLSLKCTGRKRFGFNLIGLFEMVMTTWLRNKIIIITIAGKK